MKVFAGYDQVSIRKLYLTETVPPGLRAAREAEKARWLTVVDVEAETRRSYEAKIHKHVRPLLARGPLRSSAVAGVGGDCTNPFRPTARRS